MVINQSAGPTGCCRGVGWSFPLVQCKSSKLSRCFSRAQLSVGSPSSTPGCPSSPLDPSRSLWGPGPWRRPGLQSLPLALPGLTGGSGDHELSPLETCPPTRHNTNTTVESPFTTSSVCGGEDLTIHFMLSCESRVTVNNAICFIILYHYPP